jgi:hypothetical protein
MYCFNLGLVMFAASRRGHRASRESDQEYFFSASYVRTGTTTVRQRTLEKNYRHSCKEKRAPCQG